MSDRPSPSSPAPPTGRAARRRSRWPRDGYDIAALDVAAPLAYPGYGMGTAGELESLRAECEALGATA